MITSLSNPKVKQIARLHKKSKERSQSGTYIAEGTKLFEEAPLSEILEVYVSEEYESRGYVSQGYEFKKCSSEKYNSGKCNSEKYNSEKYSSEKCNSGEYTFWGKDNKVIREKLNQTGYETVSREVFLKMSDTQTPQGILTLLRQPRYGLNDMLKASNPLLVLLEDLQDPGNLGTILRTAEGAGVTGILMSRNTTDIFNPKVIRSTMGSIYRMPFAYVEDFNETIQSLHKNGITTYAAHLAGQDFYDQVSYQNPTAFLIGNESSGLKESTAELANVRIRIPMEGKVESLNASVAASLLMYEGHRQRSGRHKS